MYHCTNYTYCNYTIAPDDTSQNPGKKSEDYAMLKTQIENLFPFIYADYRITVWILYLIFWVTLKLRLPCTYAWLEASNLVVLMSDKHSCNESICSERYARASSTWSTGNKQTNNTKHTLNRKSRIYFSSVKSHWLLLWINACGHCQISVTSRNATGLWPWYHQWMSFRFSFMLLWKDLYLMPFLCFSIDSNLWRSIFFSPFLLSW